MPEFEEDARSQQLEMLTKIVAQRENVRRVVSIMVLSPHSTVDELKAAIESLFGMFDATVDGFISLSDLMMENHDQIDSIIEKTRKL